VFSPARHQFVDCSRAGRHEQVQASALGRTAACRRSLSVRVGRIVVSLQQGDALDAVSQSVGGEQAADASADHQRVTVHMPSMFGYVFIVPSGSAA
jgi:hypothetical protein